MRWKLFSTLRQRWRAYWAHSVLLAGSVDVSGIAVPGELTITEKSNSQEKGKSSSKTSARAKRVHAMDASHKIPEYVSHRLLISEIYRTQDEVQALRRLGHFMAGALVVVSLLSACVGGLTAFAVLSAEPSTVVPIPIPMPPPPPPGLPPHA